MRRRHINACLEPQLDCNLTISSTFNNGRSNPRRSMISTKSIEHGRVRVTRGPLGEPGRCRLLGSVCRLADGLTYLKNNSLRIDIVGAVVASVLLIASAGFLGYIGFLFFNPWHR